MQWLAVSAEQIGFWGDQLISVVGITFCLIACGFVVSKRRQVSTEHMEDLEAERKANLQNANGPPRFNG